MGSEMCIRDSAHIGADPMVVGHNPSKDCRIKLAKLTQGDRESVRTYYRRFRKILDFGEAQNPPVIIDEESRIGHFIGLTESMGLRPELQMLTNNHSPTAHAGYKKSLHTLSRQWFWPTPLHWQSKGGR